MVLGGHNLVIYGFGWFWLVIIWFWIILGHCGGCGSFWVIIVSTGCTRQTFQFGSEMALCGYQGFPYIVWSKLCSILYSICTVETRENGGLPQDVVFMPK